MEQELEVKKAILPIAGLATRFLPLSLAIPKEFLPLVDKPLIQHIVEEVKRSGIKEIVFVGNPKQKNIVNYFGKYPDLEKVLVKRKKDKILKELKDFEEAFGEMKFSFALQKNPAGDGHAILQGAKLIGQDPAAVSFNDDVVASDTPAISQLISIFKTSNAPVIALKQMQKDKIPAYGNVAVEKIADRLYKIKKIIEKPDPSEVKSNLVIVGKYVLTPEVFEYLKKASPSKKGEIILSEVLEKMIESGKTIYGYELKGDWLECGDKLKWLKSFFYLALKDPIFGKELKDYLKTLR